jgi:hypothetical protein
MSDKSYIERNTERLLDNAEVYLERVISDAEYALSEAKQRLKEWRKDRTKTDLYEPEG